MTDVIAAGSALLAKYSVENSLSRPTSSRRDPTKNQFIFSERVIPNNQTEARTKRMSALVEEMSGESDRAVAIVGAAWVEEGLTEAISAFLRPHPAVRKRLFGTAGPLSSLSAKVDLAFMLNMVSELIRADLHVIRQVRNEFAHHIAHKLEHTRLDFSAEHIRGPCLAFRCVAHERHVDPRVAFTRACATLNADFEMVVFMTEQIRHSGQLIAAIESAHGATIVNT